MRHRRDDPGTGPRLTDVLGDLLEVSEDVLVVRTRRGRVTVARDAVVAVKAVPPPPQPRFDPAAVDVETVQRVAGASWPAPEQEQLGDWTLRAAGGWTRRANSVLALGGPGCGWRQALATARAWYAERGLPLLLQVPDGETSQLLVPALRSAGMAPFGTTEVLAGDLGTLEPTRPGRVDPAPEVEWGTGTDAAWVEAYRQQRAPTDETGAEVLTAPGAQLGSAGARRGRQGGIVRLWTSPRSGPEDRVVGSWAGSWAVLSCLWVAPSQRGRGLGTALTVAAARRARDLGARGLLLQVLPGNDAATALYRRLGLRPHHRYSYWAGPDTGA